MPSRRHPFTTTVLKQGPNPYVVVPAASSKAFARYADRGRVRVIGTLAHSGRADGRPHEIRGNLVPRSRGHWLFLHTGMRAFAGVGVGDRVDVVLRAVPWDEVPLPRDARSALDQARLLASFEALSANERHERLRWIDIAENEVRRAARIADLIDALTGQNAPAKPGQAHRRRKPLWICPQCEHAFVNVNQWHSCTRFTLDQSFSGAGPGVRDLFQRLRALVEAQGNVRLQAYRDHVAFVVRVRFIGATPRRKWLDVGFWLPRRIESPRFRKVETLTPTDHVHILRVTEASELDDEVTGWIREGYAVGEQRHLA